MSDDNNHNTITENLPSEDHAVSSSPRYYKIHELATIPSEQCSGEQDLHLERLVNMKIIRGTPKSSCRENFSFDDYKNYYLCTSNSKVITSWREFIEGEGENSKAETSFILCNYPLSIGDASQSFTYKILDLRLCTVRFTYPSNEKFFHHDDESSLEKKEEEEQEESVEQPMKTLFSWSIEKLQSETTTDENQASALDETNTLTSSLHQERSQTSIKTTILYTGSHTSFPTAGVDKINRLLLENNNLFKTVVLTCYQRNSPTSEDQEENDCFMDNEEIMDE